MVGESNLGSPIISNLNHHRGASQWRLLLRPQVQLICAIAMVSMVGSAAIAPALPVIQQALNIGPEQIGLVFTMFSLPGIFAIPITGILADRYGRRAVIAPLLMLYGVAGGGCFFAADFETLLGLRFLAGIGASSLSSLSLVLVGDSVTTKDYAAVFGYRIAMGQIASGVLPLAGGFLALLGWQYPFLIFFLAVPVGFLALAILDPDEGRPSTSLRTYAVQVWRGLTNKRVAALLTIAPTLMLVIHGMFLAYFPIFMVDAFTASAPVIGTVLIGRVITSVAVASMMGWLTRYIRPEHLVIGAILILGSAVALIPLMPSLWSMLLPVGMVGLASGIGFPAFQSILIGEAPAELRAAVMSANGMTNRIGQTIGPLIAGFIFAVSGIDAVFYCAAVYLAAMAIFFMVVLRR